ncbi:MAG: hypothetical protein QOI78_3192, partial [Actinomycetota bacterium]|nr:hypothetical protein [Actinomycetota bacterium]
CVSREVRVAVVLLIGSSWGSGLIPV